MFQIRQARQVLQPGRSDLALRLIYKQFAKRYCSGDLGKVIVRHPPGGDIDLQGLSRFDRGKLSLERRFCHGAQIGRTTAGCAYQHREDKYQVLTTEYRLPIDRHTRHPPQSPATPPQMLNPETRTLLYSDGNGAASFFSSE